MASTNGFKATSQGAWRGMAACVALALANLALCAHAADLAAGPMAGHRDARSTIIWLQGNAPAKAQIEYWPENAGTKTGLRKRSAPVLLQPAEDYAASITLAQLQPGTDYRYRVLIDGKEARVPELLRFRTEALWQWRKHSFIPAQGHTPPDFTVAFGSCAYVNDAPYDRALAPTGKPYGGDPGIFASIAAKKPDVMLWLGDYLYLREADYGSPSGMAARWRFDRSQPQVQTLLRTGNHYAIWDDHDYRDADSAQNLPGKSMFGPAQLRWLKIALLASTSRFKVIVAGNQMLKEVPARIEGWSHFADERREFLDWLGTNRVNGIVFLSGDRHHTELNKQERHGAYPLYDFTCSPLTSGVHAPGRNEDMSRADPGTVVNQHNFCTLDFSGLWGERRMTLKSFDAGGRELWKREIGAADLMHARE